MPRCLIVQHVAPEVPGSIALALDAAGVAVDLVELFAGDTLPADLGSHDGLVVLGGPMSAGSDDAFPTRRAEVALLSDAVARGVPTLGVCLGAQLLTLCAGGEILAGEGPEIGWGPVSLTAASSVDPLLHGLPTELNVLHWHGDTFGLPAHATRLAGSARYRQQAFRIGEQAWGLQFHVEVDEAMTIAFVDAFPDDVRTAGASGSEIRRSAHAAIEALRPHRDRILGRFAARVRVGAADPAPGGQTAVSQL